jgi:hypothetical protein
MGYLVATGMIGSPLVTDAVSPVQSGVIHITHGYAFALNCQKR